MLNASKSITDQDQTALSEVLSILTSPFPSSFSPSPSSSFSHALSTSSAVLRCVQSLAQAQQTLTELSSAVDARAASLAAGKGSSGKGQSALGRDWDSDELLRFPAMEEASERDEDEDEEEGLGAAPSWITAPFDEPPLPLPSPSPREETGGMSRFQMQMSGQWNQQILNQERGATPDPAVEVPAELSAWDGRSGQDERAGKAAELLREVDADYQRLRARLMSLIGELETRPGQGTSTESAPPVDVVVQSRREGQEQEQEQGQGMDEGVPRPVRYWPVAGWRERQRLSLTQS